MSLIKSTEILIPQVKDMSKWAVVSVDQFTSQRDYWHKLENYIGESESSLKIVFPEVYLEDGDAAERIENINNTMLDYLDKGVFKSITDSFVLVKRTNGLGETTLGIVLAVDLEKYSFLPSDSAAIRATEGFVPDRIPPRLKIRENAPIETPHIILLIDDRNRTVIEPFYNKKSEYEKLYDFELNMDGGHLEGYRIPSSDVISAFENFEQSNKGIYGEETEFVIAVGDGNHSLATAKTHWDKIKGSLTPEERDNHPARFALCELQNLHSEGLVFEPIYRCVFGVDEEDFIEYLNKTLIGKGSVELYSRYGNYTVTASGNSAKAIAQLQSAIDSYLKMHSEASVDYIHGTAHLKSVAEEKDGIAILMPKIIKEDLFGYILKHGALCRKAFSMGEAEGKRYYLEAKKIK